MCKWSAPPEELLGDTLCTGDENVQAAALGVDLIDPVPGRAPAGGPETMTLDVLAWDERTGAMDACSAGHRQTSCSYDTAKAMRRAEMQASACGECPFRQ